MLTLTASVLIYRTPVVSEMILPNVFTDFQRNTSLFFIHFVIKQKSLPEMLNSMTFSCTRVRSHAHKHSTNGRVFRAISFFFLFIIQMCERHAEHLLLKLIDFTACDITVYSQTTNVEGIEFT